MRNTPRNLLAVQTKHVRAQPFVVWRWLTLLLAAFFPPCRVCLQGNMRFAPQTSLTTAASNYRVTEYLVIATAVARYTFSARNNQDLELRRGDKLEILEDRFGWCRARSVRGVGYAPCNHLVARVDTLF